MKYLVLRGVVVNGKPHQPGDVVELEGSLVNELLGYNKIAPYTEKSVPKQTDRSVGLDEETKPKTKTKAKPRAKKSTK